MTDLKAIQGRGRDTDRVDALREALIDAIAEHGTGMSVAAVVGTLHTLGYEIFAEWRTQDD